MKIQKLTFMLPRVEKGSPATFNGRGGGYFALPPSNFQTNMWSEAREMAIENSEGILRLS